MDELPFTMLKLCIPAYAAASLPFILLVELSSLRAQSVYYLFASSVSSFWMVCFQNASLFVS
jgi:hypothetical protein